ncbi:hypothetical protein QLX08_010040 [Tetragonisca angustula]|uniref:Uncharacterized protein n=1 Tax=Tetragonisca angustula TaxID=166442 RepID=A0AAW0ZDJ8_9HYME
MFTARSLLSNYVPNAREDSGNFGGIEEAYGEVGSFGHDIRFSAGKTRSSEGNVQKRDDLSRKIHLFTRETRANCVACTEAPAFRFPVYVSSPDTGCS